MIKTVGSHCPQHEHCFLVTPGHSINKCDYAEIYKILLSFFLEVGSCGCQLSAVFFPGRFSAFMLKYQIQNIILITSG